MCNFTTLKSLLFAIMCLCPISVFGQLTQSNRQPSEFVSISHSFFRQDQAGTGLEKSELEESDFEVEDGEEEGSEEERIETDRHDFTQSPRTVGRGVIQLEYGFLFTSLRTEYEREVTYATPELVIRYGLTDRIELKTRWNYAWKFIEDEDDLDSAEDIRMALKFETTDQCRWRPDAALELRFTAPTGGSDFTTGRVEAGADYVYAWKFAEYFNLAASTGFATNGLGEFAFVDPEPNRDDHFIAWTQSVALGAEMTERSTGYFEWFGLASHGRDEEFNIAFLNFGIDYFLNADTVLDVRIGWGLTEQSDDIFVGVGGGFRF